MLGTFAGGLTDRELEAMRVLWQPGEQKPDEIREQYGRPVKSPAIGSVPGVLVSKGYARRGRKGKAFYYRAVLSRADALRGEARRLAATLSDGSIPGLVRELAGINPVRRAEAVRRDRIVRESGWTWITCSRRPRWTRRRATLAAQRPVPAAPS